MKQYQYCLCKIHVQDHIVKHSIHFNFLLTRESEALDFSFSVVKEVVETLDLCQI
jgi:hypothetical protein